MPEDFETAVMGEVGLAWGTFLEPWQDKGQPPEQARVRFSKVLTKGAQAGRWYCTTATFSLLRTMGTTQGPHGRVIRQLRE